jgi:glycosyltransferase involved in cell wall biosynthesis
MAKFRKAIIYYGGFAFRGGGAFMHAKIMRTELERDGWLVELITLENLPWPVRYLPHLVANVLNHVWPPMGYFYKDRMTGFFYKRLFGGGAQLLIFEDIYLSWNSSIPSVALVHAVWSDNLHSIKANASGVKRLIKAEGKVIDSINHPMITVSDAYRTSLIENHAGSPKLGAICVVPSGLDLDAFAFSGDQQRAAKSLVYCGSMEPRKNVRFLFEVFKQLHALDADYRLTIIGDGPDWEHLEAFALQHALPVKFCGRLTRDDVIAELRRHSLYVHPSVKESFSFALLEAKLTGLKTIAAKGLEVPVEFIDVQVASFQVDDWLSAIRRAEHEAPKKFDAHAYSSRRMMQNTLALAFGPAGV